MKVVSACTIHRSVQNFFSRTFVSILWTQYWQKCKKLIFQNRQVSRDVTSLLQLLCSEDRSDFIHMKEEPITSEQSDIKQVAFSLLPTLEDNTALQNNICVIMSPVPYNDIPYFKNTRLMGWLTGTYVMTTTRRCSNCLSGWVSYCASTCTYYVPHMRTHVTIWTTMITSVQCTWFAGA